MAKEAKTAVLLSQRKVALNERLLKIRKEKKEIRLIQQSLLSIGEELHEAGKLEAGPSLHGEAASVAGGSSPTPQPPQPQGAGSPPTAGSPSPAGCPPPYPSEGCSSRLAEVNPQDDLELLFSSGRSEWDDDSVHDVFVRMSNQSGYVLSRASSSKRLPNMLLQDVFTTCRRAFQRGM
ncbi:uncharacterized protein LOC120555330 isoform X1 [Perca fluviatilis]|uniref:uncharacterized protein LOC120555330 isoform X1 n=1 Tax=Perca fluviatilis TaxID=8168 RepID=UPI00196327BE|nr:uncharacterized protein LOC120555330 isoform X1 [Perca fluviatilis]